MLSEKAKGKQRAIDPLELAHYSRTCYTLHNVKQLIRRQRTHLTTKRLRFIHSGALLPDTTVVFSWLTELDEKRKVGAADDQSPSPTWLQCSVGREIQEGESEEGKRAAQLRPARGFDRLASVGFSEADIANFRQQFHSQSAVNYLDTEFETEEEYDEHARSLEEEWIDSLDGAGSPSLSQNTSASNPVFLQGVLVGFFFPILPFFFFRNTHPPIFWDEATPAEEPAGSVVFSKFMQMGLVVGFAINILLGAWRLLLAS
ncbi:Ubiquitin-like domain-containing protein [Mycena kentingensis (nom. inval.)]|nr:Ubiquitin-like domain-containing protein [Mycena kentingensis (nom. inval.)]